MARIIKNGVAIALLLVASVAAHAAGLGKLTVSSALGQILNAEIDLVSVQPGELDLLTARVAAPEAYRDARIEYSSALRLLRFSVEKRANGQPYLKVTSVGPINEPFVDVLIEVTWPAGRIQREYPILLDPPGFAEARVAPVAAPPPPPASKVESPPAAAPAAAPSSPAPEAPAASAAPSAAPSAKAEMAASTKLVESPGGSGETYGPVQKGETLRKIAGEVKPSSVSMEQMLVALYRENQAAFIDNNMNRLKAGQILKVPVEDEIAKIEDKDANKEIRTHVANWKAYREQLAGGVGAIPPKPETSRAAAGKVTSAAVAPPAPPAAETKDVLKLSKSESGKAAAAAGKAGGASQDRLNALQEEVTAKDKALKEAQSRVADLEKQIRDMQRLLDLKGGVPAKADDKGAKPAETKVAAKPEEPPKVAEAKPAEAPKPVEAPKPAEPPKVAEAPKPAEAAKPAEAPKPAETPKPAAAPKKAAPPPPPPPGLMDELLDNPAYIAAGAGGVGLLGLGAFLLARRRKARAEAGPNSSMTSAFPSDLKPNTVTGKSGGGLVDTGNSSFLTDFDKTGPGTIDTDEVDPVAEAEVYIAYGRDAQAEEILKEAMARDKSRHEISLKLLEIYHARKSATAFETVAKELRNAAGEASPVWQKAAAMGAQIDPTNPLYLGAEASAAAAAAPAAAHPKPNLDFDLESSAGGGQPAAGAPEPSFDLDLDAQKSTPDLATDSAPALDFDIAPSAPAVDVPLEAPKEEKPAFDFDLSGLDFPASKPAAAAPAPAASAAPDISFDFDKTLAPGAPASAGALNLTDLSLDAGGGGGGASADSVNTKLELAKAYLEIGDKDGAREILQEVVKEGSASQKDEAQKLIASL